MALKISSREANSLISEYLTLRAKIKKMEDRKKEIDVLLKKVEAVETGKFSMTLTKWEQDYLVGPDKLVEKLGITRTELKRKGLLTTKENKKLNITKKSA